MTTESEEVWKFTALGSWVQTDKEAVARTLPSWPATRNPEDGLPELVRLLARDSRETLNSWPSRRSSTAQDRMGCLALACGDGQRSSTVLPAIALKLGSSPNLDDHHTRELLKITECARVRPILRHLTTSEQRALSQQCGGWRLRGSRTGYDLDAKIAIHVRNLPSNRGLGILSATSRIACIMDAVDALENQ